MQTRTFCCASTCILCRSDISFKCFLHFFKVVEVFKQQAPFCYSLTCVPVCVCVLPAPAAEDVDVCTDAQYDN